MPTESLPSEDAEKLARFKIVVRFVFVLEHAAIVFKDPEGKAPLTDRCEKFSATLKECKREDKGVRVSFSFQPLKIDGPLFGLGRVTFKDGDSQEQLVGQLDPEYGPESPSPISYTMCSDPFPLPITAVQEVSIRVPSRVHTERIEIPLKDLKLK